MTANSLTVERPSVTRDATICRPESAMSPAGSQRPGWVCRASSAQCLDAGLIFATSLQAASREITVMLGPVNASPKAA